MTSLAKPDRSGWQADAACQGQMGVAFYPPVSSERRKSRSSREAQAKRVCATCPVSTECLDHAVAVGERYGIWGGLTFAERKHLHG